MQLKSIRADKKIVLAAIKQLGSAIQFADKKNKSR